MDQICYTYVFSQKSSILGFPCEVLKKMLLNVADLFPLEIQHPPSFISPGTANPLSMAEMYPVIEKDVEKTYSFQFAKFFWELLVPKQHPTVPRSWGMAEGLRQTHFPSTHAVWQTSQMKALRIPGKFFLALWTLLMQEVTKHGNSGKASLI